MTFRIVYQALWLGDAEVLDISADFYFHYTHRSKFNPEVPLEMKYL